MANCSYDGARARGSESRRPTLFIAPAPGVMRADVLTATADGATRWALGIAAWGAVTGTLSLALQWWNTRYRFREPIVVSGNVDTTDQTLTFTVRNRDPQLDARIERIEQLRRRNLWSYAWYELPSGEMTRGATVQPLPVDIAARRAETFVIHDEYFARAAGRARNGSPRAGTNERVQFQIRAGSGSRFRFSPYVNGKPQRSD
jgi:hypothetical protein